MDASFKKIKKKFLVFAIIKSLICGVSAGLFAVGAVLLALKLAGIPIHGGYYALIGICVASVCFGIVFPFMRQDDLKVARKLDKDYALRERVETMVAFEKDGGDIACLQREDAQTKLENLPKKKPDFKKLWQYILIPFVAVALFVSAVAVKDRYPDGDDSDKVYAVTQWQLNSLKEIIDNVGDCELSEGVKQSTVETLEGFYNALVLGVPEITFNTVLLATVRAVDGILASESTYYAICTQLVTSEAYEPLADTVVSSVKAFQGLVKVNSYDAVKARAAELEADIDKLCRLYLLNGEDSLLNHFKKITQEEGLMYRLNEYKDGLAELLEKSQVQADDGLVGAFSSFMAGIAETTELERRTDEYIYRMLQLNAFDPLANSLPFYLYLQSYNYLVDEYIRERLATVFGYPSANLPLLKLDVEKPNGGGEEPEDPGEEGPPGGGLGPGDIHYGSDDIIYDPEKGYVSYGEVINEYYSRVLGQIIEGGIPEDVANILTKYFDLLMSGIEDKDDGQEDKNN